MRGMEGSRSRARLTRTIPRWRERRPLWGWTCGNTRTTSSTRTAGQIISRRGGTWSIGTRSQKGSARRRAEERAEKGEPKKSELKRASRKERPERSAAELDGRARAARPISLFIRSSRLVVLGSLFSARLFRLALFGSPFCSSPYGTTLLFGSSLTTHNPELTSFTYAMSFL